MAIVHSTAIIGPEVVLEDGVFVGPYCVIQGNTVIGAGTRLEAHCSIGTPAEHNDFFETPGRVRIGHSCVIREFVTINAGTEKTTTVGDRSVFLRGSHVGHDSVVASDCTVSCNVLVGGHSHLQRGANLGLGATLHQFSVIGAYAMVGMGTVVTKKSRIHPGLVYVGNPARYVKQNRVGLNRHGVSDILLDHYVMEYERLVNGN